MTITAIIQAKKGHEAAIRRRCFMSPITCASTNRRRRLLCCADAGDLSSSPPMSALPTKRRWIAATPATPCALFEMAKPILDGNVTLVTAQEISAK